MNQHDIANAQGGSSVCADTEQRSRDSRRDGGRECATINHDTRASTSDHRLAIGFILYALHGVPLVKVAESTLRASASFGMRANVWSIVPPGANVPVSTTGEDYTLDQGLEAAHDVCASTAASRTALDVRKRSKYEGVA